MEVCKKLIIKNQFDYLQLSGDKNILPIINNETILFTDKISKINRFGFSQERYLIITNKALYNLKKKKLKRRIDISTIRGITITKSTDEFVVHGNDLEYDYDFISQNRKKILELVSKTFYELNKTDIKICRLDVKSLKFCVTSKKEKKKDANYSRMPLANIISVSEFIYEKKNDDPMPKKTGQISRTKTVYSKKKEINEVNLDQFKIIKVLGRGTFGKVTLVEHLLTKELFAMKSLKKDILLDYDQIENTLLEKKILETLEHPFLVGLTFCFQTEERLYFIIQFMRGGELFQHIKRFRFFDEVKARFYCCQISLALDHLHNYGIVYRDLKPENILMDEEGYLKLADFGMAKHLKGNEKALSFCGTPEYISPEIIAGQGITKSSDWWSFGILLYEMLFGIPPFYNENPDRMYELIQFAELRFPKKSNISNDAKDIITKLLDKNPPTRLCSSDGINEIKNHPFLKNIDFGLIIQKKIIPPFKPELRDRYDVNNFDDEFTSEDIDPSFIPQKNLDYIKRNQDKFKIFNN